MDKRLATVLLIILSGCTSLQLAPSGARTKTYTLATPLTKEALFDRLQALVSRGGGQIRVNDRTSGIIGLRANTPCSALKLGNGYATDERLWYFLELKAEDKKVTATFTDIEADSYGVWDSGLRPSTQVETEKAAAECLEPLVNSVKEKI